MRHLRSLGAAAAAATLVFGAASAAQGSTPAGAAAPAGGGPAPAADPLPAGGSWQVTLITGDVVSVRGVAGGPPLVTIRPGAGRQGVTFGESVDGSGHVRVLPGDVTPLVGKVLDPTLFDVTTLILDGDADANRSTLPLIVRGEGNVSGRDAARTFAAAQPGLALPSIDAQAVAEPKAQAVAFGARLAAMATASRRAGRLNAAITGSVSYIWLDRTVHAQAGSAASDTSAASSTSDAGVSSTSDVGAQTVSAASASSSSSTGPLDHNLVQIGAPAAWSRGDTGRGVTVAVLDTGVDPTFPDLAGRVAAAENFSTSPDTVDRFGHGTFVTDQLAGTGVASNGERRGVAYDSRLLVGKVLGDDGSGSDSQVIAGMQWAAPQARVISMSLGQNYPSDGTDPLSQAVDQLSAADGVLFVIAAGNAGPGEQSVGAPGSADSALTVGAVDGQDALASFSSRGPRLNDDVIKPEIVAPGVNIVGARAAGTAMGPVLSKYYVVDSGTSMATPQVAGAAAILYQLHPDWTPAQVKADLVATAQKATGGDEYELGGGRLDIAAAISAPAVLDQAVADLGTNPGTATAPVVDKLNLANTTGKPEDIDVSAELTDRSGRDVPAGTVQVTAATHRIAAGATDVLTLEARPGMLASRPGLFEGHVTVHVQGRTIHIPVSLQITPAEHLLTINASALPGTAAGAFSGYVNVINADDSTLYNDFIFLDSDGSATLLVPDGDYWVSGQVTDSTDPNLMRTALVGKTDVQVSRDTTVSLDASKAVPITASTAAIGRASEYDGSDIWLERGIGDQTFGTGLYTFAPSTQTTLYAEPAAAPRSGTQRVSTGFRLIDTATPAAYTYNIFHNLGDTVPDNLAYEVTPKIQAHGLAEVDERFYALDGNTMPYGENVYGLTDTGYLALQFMSTVPGGSTRTDYFTTEPGISWNQEAIPPFTQLGTTSTGDWVTEIPGFTHYRPGSRTTADWAREVFRPGPYSGTKFTTSFCAPLPSTRASGDIHVELVNLQDLTDGFDCLQGSGATTQTMQLFRDGKSLGTVAESIGDFTVPANTATYKLVYDESTAAIPVSTSTSTTWTFTSKAPSAAAAMVNLPLLSVDYALPLDLDNHPDGDTAAFTVARTAGSGSAPVTGLKLWTSTNGGRTWTAAPVRDQGDGHFTATLPHVASGQAVSLRVQAADAGGSSIDQTIITAYHG